METEGNPQFDNLREYFGIVGFLIWISYFRIVFHYLQSAVLSFKENAHMIGFSLRRFLVLGSSLIASIPATRELSHWQLPLCSQQITPLWGPTITTFFAVLLLNLLIEPGWFLVEWVLRFVSVCERVAVVGGPSKCEGYSQWPQSVL